jgi:hypothetical protein
MRHEASFIWKCNTLNGNRNIVKCSHDCLYLLKRRGKDVIVPQSLDRIVKFAVLDGRGFLSCLIFSADVTLAAAWWLTAYVICAILGGIVKYDYQPCPWR